jgi:carbon monoxide dehydrogenase subunit G
MRTSVVVTVVSVVSTLSLGALALARGLATGQAARRVERVRTVAAPPEVVVAELGDLRRWAAWAPWGPDGDARRVLFGGAPAGPGASAYWADGAGARFRLTVVATTASGVDLELERPGAPPADLELRVAPAGGGARVALAWIADPDLSARARALLGLPGPAAAAVEVTLARLAAAVAARPARQAYRVERSIRVSAPPARVQEWIADLRRWEGWSPWDTARPGAAPVHGGPARGPGATLYWRTGEGPGAAGRLTILRVTDRAVELEVSVLGETLDVALSVSGDDAGTRVTMALAGERGEADRPPQDAEALSGDLERALSRLKALIEAAAGGAVAPMPPRVSG